jgi:hypothetical protein
MDSRRAVWIIMSVSVAVLLTLTAASACFAGEPPSGKASGPHAVSVDPPRGCPGTTVTISGSGFGDSQGPVESSSYVTFGGFAAARYTRWTDTEIKAIVPLEGATGPVKVVVGGAGSNSNLSFGLTRAFYFAEGTCRPGFDTYFCIQNPGEVAAEVKLTFMKGDGTSRADRLIVPPKSRATVNARDRLGTGDDAAHDFSTIIECTNDQAIVAERPMYFNYKGAWTGGHNVMGATGLARSLHFAEGTCRPGFDTYFCIFNPGDATAEVLITYRNASGAPPVEDSVTVPARSRATVNARDKLGTGDDADHDFTTKVECTNGQDILAERPMYFNYRGVWTGGHNVFGVAPAGGAQVFAEGTCRPGFDTYIVIEPFLVNGPNTAVIKYMLGDGTTEVQEVPVQNQRVTINAKDRLGEADDVAHDFSFKVELKDAPPGARFQDQMIVERPMYFNYKGMWTGGHDVIGGTPPGPQPTSFPVTSFYFAEGTCRPNFDSYFCLSNPNAGAARVTITYMKGDGTTDVQSLEVPANSRVTVNTKDKLGQGDDAAHDFSAKVECTNDLQISVERPMYFNYKGAWTGGHDVAGFVFPK